MRFRAHAWAILKPYLIVVVVGWALTISWMKAPSLIEDYKDGVETREKREKRAIRDARFHASSFRDYLDYKRLYPPVGTVRPASIVVWVSEYAVLDPIFWTRWSETLECGRLVDGVADEFAFYATGSVSGKLMAQSSGYDLHRWVMRKYRPPEASYITPPPIMRYPEYEADCRARSVMVIHLENAAEFDHTKVFIMYSETVQVRKL